ncbi:MAG: BON domain-containing protein [Verrucomicrobiota bacterium]
MNPSTVAVNLRRIRSTLLILLLCVGAEKAPAQVSAGQWDEVVGKAIKNNQGVLLGRVKDTAVDLERGRYVGMIVSYGGFAGIGEKTVIIPPGALRDDGTPRTLFLDMDEKTFRNAPTFQLSKYVGPPQTAKVAEVYRYFGQTPFFAVQNGPSTLNGEPLEPLGFVQKGSSIIYLPVENLQGVRLGYVSGLRDLNRVTGRLKGVVIRPYGNVVPGNMKVVQPQALRYNRKHRELRLNDHEQAFKDSASFNMSAGGRFEEENPTRPGLPPPPPVQGESKEDKAITLKIVNRVMADKQLSNYGKNIEIKTLDGKVTLRGRTVNAANRDSIVAYATKVAGAGNVINLLEVRPMTEAEKAIDR